MGTKLKMKMTAMMGKMMISCDKAAFLTSKAQEGRLSIFEKIELRVHILSCKYCKRYKQEIELLNRHVKQQNEKILQGQNGYHLSQVDKEKLKQVILSKMNK